MDYEEVCRKIQGLIDDQWSDVTPVIWPNEIEDDLDDPAYFARVSILPSSGRNAAVGGLCHRRRGVVIMQLFAKQGTGIANIGALEEKAIRIFTDHIIGGVRLFDAGADRIGQDGNGYFQSNVTAIFEFEAAIGTLEPEFLTIQGEYATISGEYLTL